jgi:hypothetical protein
MPTCTRTSPARVPRLQLGSWPGQSLACVSLQPQPVRFFVSTRRRGYQMMETAVQCVVLPLERRLLADASQDVSFPSTARHLNKQRSSRLVHRQWKYTQQAMPLLPRPPPCTLRAPSASPAGSFTATSTPHVLFFLSIAGSAPGTCSLRHPVKSRSTISMLTQGRQSILCRPYV